MPHDAQVRLQRGERVGRHLGTRPAHGAHKRALPHVGEAQQPHVREHLELQYEVAPLARSALLGAPGSAVGRGREVLVPLAAPAAARDADAISEREQLGDAMAAAGVRDQRAERHAQHEIVGRSAIAVAPLAIFTTLGFVQGLALEIEQGGQAGIDLQPDAPAPTPIATRRAPIGHVLLPAKGHHAISTAPGLDTEPTLVHEKH